ncbi:MAG: S9 family peptidase [Actinomycetota bacterium]|nr:S9 family peptidase [Actinomycetota bacterium]
MGLGSDRIDNYYWIKDSSDPDALSYIEEENAHAKSFFDQIEPLKEKFYNEFISRIKLDDQSVPFLRRHYYYFNSSDKEDQYDKHYRYDASLGLEGQKDRDNWKLILDENELAKDQPYFALGSSCLSDDEETIAYSMDTAGNELFRVFIKNLTNGETYEVPVSNATYGLDFNSDNTKLFWVEADEANRPFRINLMDLTQPDFPSTTIFEELDEGFGVGVGKTKDFKHLIVESSSTTSTEIRYIDLSDEKLELKLFHPRTAGLEVSIEMIGETCYLLANHKSIDFSVATTTLSRPRVEDWSDFYYREGVKVDSFELFADFLAIDERRNGFSRIRIVDLRDNSEYEIEAPQVASTFSVAPNLTFNSNTMRYGYSSMTTPSQLFEMDLATREVKLLKQAEVLGDFDLTSLRSEVIYITARDGVQVPVSIVYQGDRPSGAPLLLYGYGSYEHCSDPRFSILRLSLLERGITYAVAHIRGGGEMGRQWYLDGKFAKKHNTFNDFVDAAKALAADGITDPGKIVIMGGSAGGMLVGAAVNQAPELFGAVVAEVPFVDCLTTISDPSLPLTVPEWEEWGNPLEDLDIFNEMQSYSPYDNVKAGIKYPPLFITSGLSDPRVSYVEPTKWTAKLREITADPEVLLWTEQSAGHFGNSGRFNELESDARTYAFIYSCIAEESQRE